MPAATEKTQYDPITFAVIKSAFDAIVDEMAYTVMRTARSPIVRDVLDYSCTLCAADGAILTQAKTVALHLGAVPDAIEAVLDAYRDDILALQVLIDRDLSSWLQCIKAPYTNRETPNCVASAPIRADHTPKLNALIFWNYGDKRLM